jgi:hypothetical protein
MQHAGGGRRKLDAMVKLIGQAARPEEVSKEGAATADAGRYRAGQRVSLSAIAAVAEVSRPIACSVRKWARAAGRWPYADGRAGGS